MSPYPVYPFGKTLLILGGIIMVIGLLLMFGDRIPYLGKLPGDIIIRRKHFTFYFPLTTLIVLNALAWFVLWVIGKIKGS